MMKSPGPIALAAALLILALGAAWMAYSYPSSASDIAQLGNTPPNGKSPVKVDAKTLEASLTPWSSPVLWNEPSNHHRLFSSPVDYLFYPSAPSTDAIKADDGTARSPAGVLLSWYRKYDIDITQPNVDHLDPDGDGFSNITEFKNENVDQRLKAADCDGSNSTNPNDAQSHPSYLSRLRVKAYENRPFHILFNGYQELNGQTLFQIFLSDVPSDRQPPLKKEGDQLGFEGYVIGKFHKNIVKEVNPQTHVEEDVDRSTLDLIKPDIGLTTTVPYRKTIDSAESTADFVILMPADVDKVFKVARGKFLILPELPKQRFLVIEANDNGAKIRDDASKQEYHIPKLDPSDWDDVPVAPAPKSP